VLGAAAAHGRTEPELLQQFASWQTDDFWLYAADVGVTYVRAAAASRAGVPVRQAGKKLRSSLAILRDNAQYLLPCADPTVRTAARRSASSAEPCL
jgi:hypothetical protein